MRLYLCGSLSLNNLLELGGVTAIDCASSFPCIAYKRGKREKWAGFDLTRPSSFSLSYTRFKRLRYLNLYVRNLNSIVKDIWLSEITSLQILDIHIGTTEAPKNLQLICLPPHLTSLALYSKTSPGAFQLSFTLPEASGESLPSSLTQLRMPTSLAPSFVEHLPPSLLSLSSVQFYLGKQINPLPNLPPSLTELHTFIFSVTNSIELMPRSGSPSTSLIASGSSWTNDHTIMTLEDYNGMLKTFFPPTLQTLVLTVTSLPDASVLPTSITRLTLHSHVAASTSIDWNPTSLLYLDLKYSHFSASITTYEGQETIHPWYDWIYANQTLLELILRYTEPGSDDAIITTQLPTSLRKLELLGLQKLAEEYEQILAPSLFPPVLTSLALSVPSSLISCNSNFGKDRKDTQIEQDLKSFPPIKSLLISFTSWKLPHCGPLFDSLIHLELQNMSWSQFTEVISWPPLLESLIVSSYWPVRPDADVSPAISLLPKSLKRFHLNYRGVLLDWVPSWPPQLTHVHLPYTQLSFNSFFKLPTTLAHLECAKIKLDMGMRDVTRLKQFCESHPFATLDVDSWALPVSSVPRHTGSINPVKTLQILWQQPEFIDNNLLTIMNWVISD